MLMTSVVITCIVMVICFGLSLYIHAAIMFAAGISISRAANISDSEKIDIDSEFRRLFTTFEGLWLVITYCGYSAFLWSLLFSVPLSGITVGLLLLVKAVFAHL